MLDEQRGGGRVGVQELQVLTSNLTHQSEMLISLSFLCHGIVVYWLMPKLPVVLFQSFSLFQCRQYTKCLHRIKVTAKLHVATDITQIYRFVWGFCFLFFTLWIWSNKQFNIKYIKSFISPTGTLHPCPLCWCLDDNCIFKKWKEEHLWVASPPQIRADWTA